MLVFAAGCRVITIFEMPRLGLLTIYDKHAFTHARFQVPQSTHRCANTCNTKQIKNGAPSHNTFSYQSWELENQQTRKSGRAKSFGF